MNGDSNRSGYTSGVTVAEHDVPGGSPVTDNSYLAGQVLETETYPSSGSSSPDQITLNAPLNGTITGVRAAPGRAHERIRSNALDR